MEFNTSHTPHFRKGRPSSRTEGAQLHILSSEGDARLRTPEIAKPGQPGRSVDRKGTGFVTKEKLLELLDEISDEEAGCLKVSKQPVIGKHQWRLLSAALLPLAGGRSAGWPGSPTARGLAKS